MRPSLLSSDLRLAVRMLVARPAYALAAVLTMAVGIAATTSVLAAMDAVLLRELPYSEPHRLVQLFGNFRPRANMDTMPVAPATYGDWQNAAASSFSGMAAFRLAGLNVTGGDLPERLRAGYVSGSLFGVLGRSAAIGRTLNPSDDEAATAEVAVISDVLWHRRFAAAADIIGQPLTTSSGTYTIVGVMPAAFRFPIGWMGTTNVDVWVPLRLTPAERADRGTATLNIVARLAPGVSLAQVQRRMDAVSLALEHEHPETNRDWGSTVMPLSERGVEGVRSWLWLLFVAVTLLMLIACANVANLLLARGLDRRREMAVRIALGATRGRLVTHWLMEGLVVASLAGAIGLGIAFWSTRIMAALAPATFAPELRTMSVTAGLAWVTIGVSWLSALVFTAAPALVTSAMRLRSALDDGGRHGDSRASRRLRSLLVTSEVALTVLLLASAMAVVRTFAGAMAVDPGFDARDSVSVRVSLPVERYRTAQSWLSFFGDLQSGARVISGVTASALASSAPMENTGQVIRYRIVGMPVPDASSPGPIGAELNRVSTEFFGATGMRILNGRTFTSADLVGGERVAVVNEAFARRALGSSEAIGKQVVIQGDMNQTMTRADSGPPLTIVGLVADVKEYGRHRMTPPMVYLPVAQDPQRTLSLVVRGRPGQLAPVADLRAVLKRLDPDLAPIGIRSLDELAATADAPFRFNSAMLSFFAAAALVLTLGGIFAVVAYTTRQQAPEWAVRQAFGATPRRLLLTVLVRSSRAILAGLASGLLLAPAGLKLLAQALKQSLNIDVLPVDVWLLAACGSALIVVGATATITAARHLFRMDVLTPLRTR